MGLCRRTTPGNGVLPTNCPQKNGVLPTNCPKKHTAFTPGWVPAPGQRQRQELSPARAEPPDSPPEPQECPGHPSPAWEPCQQQLLQPQPSTNKPIQTQTAPGTGRGTARTATINQIIMDGCRAGLEEPLAASRAHKPRAVPAPAEQHQGRQPRGRSQPPEQPHDSLKTPGRKQERLLVVFLRAAMASPELPEPWDGLGAAGTPREGRDRALSPPWASLGMAGTP